MEKIEFNRFIERYLEGKMQPSEKLWFEKELEGNLWLRKELELRRKTDSLASNTGAINLREKLMQAETRHRTRKPIERVARKVPVNYAATILGLLIIGSLIIFSSNRLDIAKVEDSALAAYDFSTESRATSKAEPQELLPAIDLYNAGMFAEALMEFNAIPVESPNFAQSTLMAGMTSMQLEDYQKAIESFKKVIDHADNLYTEDASYYLGLSYYRIDEFDKARHVFEGIINSDNRFKKEAKKILRKIK